MNKKGKFPLRSAAALLAALLTVTLALGGCGFIEITYDHGSDTGTGEDSGTAATDAPWTVPAPTTTAIPPDKVSYPDRRAEAEAKLEALPDVELSVSDLIIANATSTAALIEPEEGDLLNAARSLRTEAACERYGISMTVLSVEESAMLDEFTAAEKAGTYYADFAVIPAYAAALFYNSGIVLNLGQLPVFEAPEGAGTVGMSCYFYCGSAVYDPDSLWALYFNRTLAGAEISESLYRAALSEAGLAWEDVLTAAASVTLPEGAYAAVSGTRSSATFAADAVCAGADVEFVSNGTGEVPTVNFDEQKLAEAGDVISRLAALLYLPAGEDAADPEAVFADGGALMRLGPLSDMRTFYDKKTEWGLLPLPHTGSVSWNVTLGAEDRPVMFFSGNGRPELCGAAITALDAASGAWLGDAYAAAAFENYLRDNNSYLTLHAILDGSVKFDFSYLYSGVASRLAGATYNAARGQLTGGASLSEAVSRARVAANRELARLFG